MNSLHCGHMSSPHTDQDACGKPCWGWRQSAAAAAVAAVIGTLGGAAIYAATDGSSHAFGAPHQGFGPAGGQHGATGGPDPAALGATSLHGEFVVLDGAGRYRTELTQTGRITALSPTTITVRSGDNYSQTYVIPNGTTGTAPPFAVDDQVVVRATSDGQTATATNIGRPHQN